MSHNSAAWPGPTDPVLTAAIRRAAWRLLPFLLLLYVLAFLDRVNVGYAKQAFLRDTGLTEAAYAFGAGIFFVGYALLEVPSNLILHRVGARTWMCRIMVSWGLISAAMMFARNEATFYSLRFMLGVAEAGFFPGVILYLTYWFPESHRGGMMGLFYFGAPLAQIFGGPLSGRLLEMDGHAGLKGWQWMFLAEGLLATAVGVWTFWYLTNHPANAKWLSEAERAALQSAMANEERAKARPYANQTLSWLREPRLLYFGAIYCLIQMSVYGVTFYLPSQVARMLGRDTGLVVGIASAIPWLCALAAAYVVPRLAQRLGRARVVAASTLALAAVGIAVSSSAWPWLAMAGLCLAAAGFIGAQPVFWTFPAASLTGIGAAGGIALINAFGAVGGFIAPNFKVFAETKWHSPAAGPLALSMTTFLGAVLIILLREPRRSSEAPRA